MRDSPSAIRRSRAGRTFASRWTVATTYAPRLVRRRDALARDRREAKRRVGHHVTDDERLSRDSFGGERRDRALVGAEQERREAVDLDPRPLLRHREVAAAEARLDVRERDPVGGRRPRSGERGVRVAEDERRRRAAPPRRPCERRASARRRRPCGGRAGARAPAARAPRRRPARARRPSAGRCGRRPRRSPPRGAPPRAAPT